MRTTHLLLEPRPRHLGDIDAILVLFKRFGTKRACGDGDEFVTFVVVTMSASALSGSPSHVVAAPH